MNEPHPPVPPRRSSRMAYAGIAAVVASLAAAFAWTAGWLTPSRVTAPRLVDSIENGKPFAGFRRAHARGVCVAGYFEPTAEAAALSKARVFTQPVTPALGRLSIGGGDPYGLEGAARVRSLALQFDTDDGQRWRLAMNSFPFFAVSTPQAFAEQILASRPDPATGKPDPRKQQAFLERHPEAANFMAWAGSAPWSNSFANTRYNGVHAFLFTNADGGENYVRWSFVPEAAFEPLDPEQRQTGAPSLLTDELQVRLARGPLRWTLELTIADAGDPIEDPSQPWPDDRRRVTAGTFVLESASDQATGACRDINFDPTMLPEGIAPSGDPVLAARAAAYAVSFNRRQREFAAGDEPAATEGAQ
ncbi:catalase family peroxidase [Arenimonas sp.]|uniref:catalase family peroxidase n=1 Tax=Arenimonas sp. TaxID=1872635 RepID=UPI0035AF4319